MEYSDSSPNIRRSTRTSSVWQYFAINDEENQTAICNHCNKVFSYKGTVTNLRKHYRSKHDIKIRSRVLSHRDVSDENESESEDKKESKANGKNHGRRRNKSAAWKFFTKIDEDKLIASCKLCGSQLSYFSSVSNLMKHLNKKHGLVGQKDMETSTDDTAETTNDDEDDDDDEDLGSDDEDKPDKSRAMVWLYFKCLDPVLKISMCLICKKRLSFTTISNLKRHLMKKHPNVKLPEENEDTQMIISSGGQLYEIETRENGDEEEHLNETNEMDTVYLDDYIEDDEPIVIPDKKRKKTNKVKTVKPTKVYRKSNSSDDEVTVTKSTSKDDSLNNFATYVVSLLRQLPKNMSDQLQMDFIKEIMNAKITLNQPVTVLPGNSYSITITDPEPSVTDATIDVVDDVNK